MESTRTPWSRPRSTRLITVTSCLFHFSASTRFHTARRPTATIKAANRYSSLIGPSLTPFLLTLFALIGKTSSYSMPRPQPQLGLATEAINLEELYAVISGAASQDVAQLQACTERLKMMMDMTGTFDGLSDIASQKTSVPLAVRQQSIIQFKNHALSHWRSRK